MTLLICNKKKLNKPSLERGLPFSAAYKGIFDVCGEHSWVFWGLFIRGFMKVPRFGVFWGAGEYPLKQYYM